MSDRLDEERLRDLMVGYQSGAYEAFEALYDSLIGPVRGWLTAVTRDVTRAEDLAQETFLQIHRARRTYDPAYPLMPWVMAIARHVYLMELRRASRRPTSDVDIEDVPLTVRSGAESHEARLDVHRAL